MRQWALLRLLEGGARAWSIKELSEQLGASKSTLERDLATLEQHFPIVAEEDGKQRRRYRLARSTVPAVQLGVGELLAAHAHVAVAPGLAATSLGEDFGALVHKLRAALAERHNGGLEQVARVFALHPRDYVDYAPCAERIDTLLDATARRLECRIVLHTLAPADTGPHLVHPLELVWHAGALYVWCWYAKTRTLGLIAAHRIGTVELTGSRFTPPRVDLAIALRRAFGTAIDGQPREVEVRFSPEVAHLVWERVFHPDEQKTRTPDGGVTYRLRTCSKWEVVAWVQRFGGHAELIAPNDWREAVHAGALRMARRHAR